MTFISTTAAQIVSPGHCIYGIAKAALNHLVRYSADEFGPKGVRTNAIGTGLIATPGVLTGPASAMMEEVRSHVPLRRLGKPIDIAGAVYFLTSDLASYVNGTILPVEGGDIYGSRGYPRMG